MRRSGASSLLAKVNSQLKGQRTGSSDVSGQRYQPVTSTPFDGNNRTDNDSDDEMNAYLAGLGKRISKSKGGESFGGISDISLSSEDKPITPSKPVKGNKFLKKKPIVEPKKVSKQPDEIQENVKQSGSMLDRVANITEKYKAKPIRRSFEDSDFDISISLDEGITGMNNNKLQSQNKFLKKKSVDSPINTDHRGKTKSKKKERSSNQVHSRGSNLLLQKQSMKSYDNIHKIDSLADLRDLSERSDNRPNRVDSVSSQASSIQEYSSDRHLAMTGNKFMKNNTQQATQGLQTSEPENDHFENSFQSEDLDRYMVNISVTDEDIHSDRPITPDHNKGSPLGNIQLADIDSIESGHITPPHYDNTFDDISSPGLGGTIKLMDLDDLEPVSVIKIEVTNQTERTGKQLKSASTKSVQFKKTETKTRIQTPDIDMKSVHSEISEIRTETATPDRGRLSRQSIRSSENYTEDFTDDVVTDKSDDDRSGKDDITTRSNDVTSVPETDDERQTGRLSAMSTGRLSAMSKYSKYSDDFTEQFSGSEVSERSARISQASTRSESRISERSRSSQSSRHSVKKSRKKQNTVGIQTDAPPVGLSYTWSTGGALLAPSVGLGYVDPTPVATHVIGPDSLEAMTAYSPSMLALNDMMKQQLLLTRHFVQRQHLMYQAYTSSLSPNHKYTTYKDTKKYIKKHRKSRLTFDEALKQVKQEMADGYR